MATPTRHTPYADALAAICDYWHSRRRAGHTTAQIKGVQANPEILYIALDERHASQIREEYQIPRTVSAHDLERKILGLKSPLVVDHEVIRRGIAELANIIDFQDGIIGDQREHLGRQIKDLDQLREALERQTERAAKARDLLFHAIVWLIGVTAALIYVVAS